MLPSIYTGIKKRNNLEEENEFQCLCQIVRIRCIMIVIKLIWNLLALFCSFLLVVGSWLTESSSSIPLCSTGKLLESSSLLLSTEFSSRLLLRSDPSVLLEPCAEVFPCLHRLKLFSETIKKRKKKKLRTETTGRFESTRRKKKTSVKRVDSIRKACAAFDFYHPNRASAPECPGWIHR